MLELEERGQRFTADTQGGKDRNRLGDRLLQAVDPPQLHIDPGEVERDHGDFVRQVSFNEALARLQERGLGGSEMPEIPQELTFLPAGPEKDDVVFELLVELSSFKIQRKGLLGL